MDRDANAPPSPATIMVVEDEVIVAEDIRRRLIALGYVLKPFEERELRTTVEMALFNHGVGRKVRSSERRYRTLLEDAADAILLIDPSGTIFDVNGMALRLLGCSRQEVMERPVSELLVAGDQPAFPLPGETGATVRTEGLLRRLEKEHFVADFSSRLIALTPEEVERELPDLLASLGEFTGADRVTLCFLDRDGTGLRQFHEWGKDGRIALGPALAEHLPALHWSLGRLAGGEMVCLYQVDDLPREAAAEGRFWTDHGVRSLAIVPVLVSRRLHGFLACTAEVFGRMWNGEDLRLLRVLGDILGNVMDRLHVLAELRLSEERFRRMRKNPDD